MCLHNPLRGSRWDIQPSRIVIRIIKNVSVVNSYIFDLEPNTECAFGRRRSPGN